MGQIGGRKGRRKVGRGKKMKENGGREDERERQRGWEETGSITCKIAQSNNDVLHVCINLQTQIPIIFIPSLWPGCQLTVVTIC